MAETTAILKFESFEGPIDLLFHLIEKNELDIYDIPISLLTDQYLQYLEGASRRDMERLSEFFLMAATLLEIKSKLLLPAPKRQEGEEQAADPREELVARLVEYKRYKEAADALRELELSGARAVYKQADSSLSLDFSKAPPIDILLGGVSLDRLFALFTECLNRRELKTDKIRQGFTSVTHDVYTVSDKIEQLSSFLRLHGKFRFFAALSRCACKIEKVVTFLALLDMIKTGTIRIVQERLFEEIEVFPNSCP